MIDAIVHENCRAAAPCAFESRPHGGSGDVYTERLNSAPGCTETPAGANGLASAVFIAV